MCTNEVENAVYVAAGNDPYELLEVTLVLSLVSTIKPRRDPLYRLDTHLCYSVTVHVK